MPNCKMNIKSTVNFTINDDNQNNRKDRPFL